MMTMTLEVVVLVSLFNQTVSLLHRAVTLFPQTVDHQFPRFLENEVNNYFICVYITLSYMTILSYMI